MLETLSIQNFRSIRQAHVKLSPSGLTVLVGANGSGKSNFVKCLTFIGGIARDGLDSTVRAHRGFEGILPKYIPAKSVRRGTESVRLAYTVRLHPPDDYPKNGPPLRVSHELTIAPHPRLVAQVSAERLVFREPLLLAATLPDAPRDSAKTPPRGSTITITRVASGALRVDASPPLEGDFRDGYLKWLGLDFVKDFLTDATTSEEFAGRASHLLSLGRDGEDNGKPEIVTHSLLEPEAFRLTTFSPAARVLRSYLGHIKRYDFQLANLRTYQETTATDTLRADGTGLPAAVRHLEAQPESWRRLQETLRTLAPHVKSATAKLLNTGQEFIEFIERQAGRPVESWESSDGTLRALAILVAVETCPRQRTLLIEEPEQGLHPWAVRTVIAHLRETMASRGLQLVITTHSQQVLDCASAEEVVVASRGSEQGTVFGSSEDFAPGSTMEPGALGRLWVKGLLGGVPTAEE